MEPVESTPAPENTRALSIGESRVRTTFNPSAQSDVDTAKQQAAQLINVALGIVADNPNPEVKRIAALAATAFEEGAMWLVKAMTAPK